MTRPRLSRDAVARLHAEATRLNTIMMLDDLNRRAREVLREANAALKALEVRSRSRP